MEGGTDFDLQVLEVPAAAAGERSQEDRGGGSRSAPADSEARGAQAEEAGAAPRGRKDSQRVSPETPAPDWTTGAHVLFLSQGASRQNGEDGDEEEDVKQTKKVGLTSARPVTGPLLSSTPPQGRKRKRSLSVDSGEGSASESDSSHSDGEEEDGEDGTRRLDSADPVRVRAKV